MMIFKSLAVALMSVASIASANTDAVPSSSSASVYSQALDILNGRSDVNSYYGDICRRGPYWCVMVDSMPVGSICTCYFPDGSWFTGRVSYQ